MCVDTSEDGDSISMLKATCSENHDAEVFAIHKLTATEADTFDPDFSGDLCASRIEDPTLLAGGEYEPYTVYEQKNAQRGDVLVCLIQRSDGTQLSEKLLD
jgi:hypothetical protein